MVRRIGSVLPVVGQAACILLTVSLICGSSAIPPFEFQQQLVNLAPLYQSHPEDDSRPFYVPCLTSIECHKGQCCVLGRQRFSIAKCSPFGGPGEFCTPGAVAVAKNLSYPDGMNVRYTGVYDLFCPCDFGLHCDPHTHQCVQDNLEFGENELDFNRPFFNDYD